MSGKWRGLILLLLIAGILYAEGEGSPGDISSPATMTCSGENIVGFTCNIMQTLLTLGPMIAIMALVLGGIIYVYANVFVTADQRGRYHSLATSLAIGALILAALVGGAGFITQAGMKFLTP